MSTARHRFRFDPSGKPGTVASGPGHSWLTAVRGVRGPLGAPRYEISYSFIALSLLDAGEQRTLAVSFPLVGESMTHEDMDRQVVWTNHPECVLCTWIETITSPAVVGTQRWYHVEFDLGPLVEPADPHIPRRRLPRG